jgi:hypothetical protein
MADILEHLLSALSDSSDNVAILGGEGRVVILAVCASASELTAFAYPQHSRTAQPHQLTNSSLYHLLLSTFPQRFLHFLTI